MPILTNSLLALNPGLALPGAVGADLASYQSKVLPFFESYGLDCHDSETQKGKLSLEGIDPGEVDGEDLETWRLIRDQRQFHDMPPAKKPQPSAGERAGAGSYKPNAWGLYDVHGNVAEWCLNGAIRGGSWVSRPENCRSADRDLFFEPQRTGVHRIPHRHPTHHTHQRQR